MTCVQAAVVVGAGVAGLTCALAIAQTGVAVRLFEGAFPLHGLPAHVDVVPSLLRDLVSLGVGRACVQTGFACQSVDVADRDGRPLYRLPHARLAGPGYPPALGMDHQALRDVLLHALAALGVQVVHTGVAGVRHDGPSARVLLDDGAVVEADLVVLATGAGSPLRRALFSEAPAVADLAQRWWYVSVPRPAGLDRPVVAVSDIGRRVWLVPVRASRASLVYVEPAAAHAPLPSSADMRDAVSRFGSASFRPSLHIAADAPWRLRHVQSGLLPAPWHRGCVLAVGDCAHTFAPHFGQSAAQAVEDALVLRELLPAASDRQALLDAFLQRRLDRVRRVHALVEQAARWDLEPDASTNLGQLLRQLTAAVAQPA